MTKPQFTLSPLSRLVLFMVCLSVAGSIIAGAHYYAVDLPEQNAQSLTPPSNQWHNYVKCDLCRNDCLSKSVGVFDSCIQDCEFNECELSE